MNILFAFAHPDDEAFGPCCTIRKLVNEGHSVTVASMCNGARPGAVHVAQDRQLAFAESCRLLGATSVIGVRDDLTVTYTEAVNYAVALIDELKPDVVYTNNISDINADHRLMAEGCLVACRPKPTSSVKELYFCEIPGSTEWSFNQLYPLYEPNVYVDVDDLIDFKRQLISLYSTENYPFPDARSVESSIVLAERRGVSVGAKHAESFKLIFSRR